MSDINSERVQVIKTFGGFSCAHRHHAAPTDCRFVHGYERSFRLVIEGSVDPKTGWLIDFGSFKPLQEQLSAQFDHTLVIGFDDPLRHHFEALEQHGACKLRPMESPGMEGAARWVWAVASTFIEEVSHGRAYLVEVEARENNKNAVRYRGINANSPTPD